MTSADITAQPQYGLTTGLNQQLDNIVYKQFFSPLIRLYEVDAQMRELLTLEPNWDSYETETPSRQDKLYERFHSLAQKWREDCAHLSSVREMVLHPAYQQIVGMGQNALPFIMRELEQKPDHWFWALRAITQEDPVRPKHRGNITQMAHDWLEWARRKGFADEF